MVGACPLPSLQSPQKRSLGTRTHLLPHRRRLALPPLQVNGMGIQACTGAEWAPSYGRAQQRRSGAGGSAELAASWGGCCLLQHGWDGGAGQVAMVCLFGMDGIWLCLQRLARGDDAPSLSRLSIGRHQALAGQHRSGRRRVQPRAVQQQQLPVHRLIHGRAASWAAHHCPAAAVAHPRGKHALRLGVHGGAEGAGRQRLPLMLRTLCRQALQLALALSLLPSVHGAACRHAKAAAARCGSAQRGGAAGAGGAAPAGQQLGAEGAGAQLFNLLLLSQLGVPGGGGASAGCRAVELAWPIETSQG